MPEFSEDGGLLRALRDEPVPPSTLDIGDLVASGRRKVQTRNWIGAAAVSAVLVAAIPVALVNARSPGALPEQPPPLATPAPAVIAPTACVLEPLPLVEGYTGSEVSGGDTSGRYLTGSVSRDGETAPVVWDNGVIMPLTFPAGALTMVVNRHGVIAGNTLKEAWVYRDGKFTTLPQPVDGVIYRAAAINDEGQILGGKAWLPRDQIAYPPIIWGSNNAVQATAGRSFMVRGIDDDGTVIGQENARQYAGDLHGLIWRPGSTVADLPTPPEIGKAGAMSIRGGWAAGLIAYSTSTDAPLKPFISHLGTKQNVAVPAEVTSVQDVNRHGWAAVDLRGGLPDSVEPGLLADGKLLRLPKPADAGPRDSLSVRTISDDGRVLSGAVGYDTNAKPTHAVRWLCQ